jgi:hypothetical protein
MPYSESLDKKISDTISDWGAERKKMFGGTCYLINGNMMCGVYRDYLILRLGENGAKEALGQPHVKPMAITGRPMKGWIMVEAAGFEGPGLAEWLSKARGFATSLPPKENMPG